MVQIGLSLYTVRHLDEPLEKTLIRASRAGYDGVELYDRLHRSEIEGLASILEKANLDVASVHIDLLDLEEDTQRLVDRYSPLGCRRFVYHPSQFVRTESRINALIDRANIHARELSSYDIDLAVHPIHNDLIPILDGPILGNLPWFSREFESASNGVVFNTGQLRTLQRAIEWRLNTIGNKLVETISTIQPNSIDDHQEWLTNHTALGHWVRRTDPELIKFELDIAFFEHMGFDPVEIIDWLGYRTPQLHMKDVRREEIRLSGYPQWVDLGDGCIDFQPVSQMAQSRGIDWLLFENGHTTKPVKSLRHGIEVLESTIGVARTG